MYADKLFVALCLLKAVTCQINGEFWWLNDKVKNYHGIDIQPVKYEYISEFDNDESDKIIFSSDENSSDDGGTEKKGNSWNDKIDVHFKDIDEMFPWSEKTNEKLILDKVMDSEPPLNTKPNEENDQLIFHFPGPKDAWITSLTENNTTVLNETNLSLIDDSIHFKSSEEENQYSQNICTYLSEHECNRRLGTLYKSKSRSKNEDSYCCILPLKENADTSTSFRYPVNRIKRSSLSAEIVTLNQRQALLQRLSPKPSSATSEITKKIVTPEEDYEDPYSNIKNVGFKTPHVQRRPKPTYGHQDYQDDEYADEVPKPGLIGIYSDHGQIPYGSTQWSDEAYDDDEAVEVGVGYGFSTLDPRLDTYQGVTSKPPRRTPPKLSLSSSEESTFESGTQTITYNANPNFQVLQGFKLLNLIHNRSSSYKKNSKKTSQTDFDYGSEEAVVVDNPTITSSSDEYDDSDVGEQIYRDCGRTKINLFDQDKLSGEAPYGSSPWLLLVMRYRRPRRILCHATLVHPRAAVTSADCVHGSKAGEITIYAGVWSLGESDKTAQQRLATVHLHPKYNPSDITNGLALLHWNRPLRLSGYVQPACLGDPHVGDSCVFIGWGGHAQTIHSRPRYQKARITTPRECSSCRAKNAEARNAKDTFCAVVETNGCVTGVGGALVCSVNERSVAVGVVVSRDSCDVTSPHVLLPAQDWIKRALSALGII